MRGTKRRYEEVQPQLQRDIVNDYRRGVRGHGYLTIAKKHQLPIETVRSVIARAERAGGDPVAPRGHKKRKLDSAEQARLYSSLDRNPFTTNQQLRARVGNKIAASTVRRDLARAKPPFTAKVAQDQEPEERTEDWKEGARKWLRGVKTIAMRRRIYEDEAPIYANEAPHKGRSRKGKPIIRARSRYATKYTLHVYAKKDRVCTGTCQTGTQTLRRSSVSQWMQPHRWMRAIHLSGTVWVVVDEHYILFTSIIAQLCERSSRNVACQSSSYLQRASILIQSNCCLTT